MNTTLNPYFDHHADQHGSISRVITLNPSFAYRADRHETGTGDIPATLNPAIRISQWQPVEHATPAADRAA
jgi:hypothetical protein